METTPNQTISSFDNTFPYMDIARNITKNYENQCSEKVRQEFYLLLNINYQRYFGTTKTNRFFHFYFETLPNYFDYLPFWKQEEKDILAKFTFAQDLRESLFRHDHEWMDLFIELLSKELRKMDPSFIHLALNDGAIKQTTNLIKSRTSRISLKGWKVLHSKLDDIVESGKN